MDYVDQLVETINRITEGQPPPARERHDFVYVVYKNGRWHTDGFSGTGMDCSEHIERREGVDLGDPKVRWARGHADNGVFYIHPKNDRDAVECITRQLASRMAQKKR